MSLTTRISKQNSSPEETYTLSLFIKAGNSTDTITYSTLCYQELINGIRYVVKNVIDDYLPELKSLALKVQLSREEVEEYKYNPKLMAYHVYGSTVYYPFILLINDMCSIREFTQDLLLLIPRNTLNSSLSSIYRAEYENIKIFNSEHN